MAFHSKLSPSGADTWMNCPGSVEAQAGLPDTPSYFSAEGTVAHSVRALCLELGMEPHDFIGQTRKSDGFEVTFTEEMAEHLVAGIDRIRDRGGLLYIEKRVSIGRWIPKQSGTLDAGIVLKNSIEIDDLKFGAGKPVTPVENRQTKLYALGFIDMLEEEGRSIPDKVKLVIDQPRCAGGGGEWETTTKDLLAFGREVKAAGKRALEGGPRIPGKEQCLWCKAARAGTCREYDEFNLDLLSLNFDDLDAEDQPELPELEKLSAKRRAYILKHASMLYGWLNQMHADALQEIMRGREMPGFKAVLGRRPHRKWNNQSAAERFMRKQNLSDHQIFKQELITPAQAEKLILTGTRGKDRKVLQGKIDDYVDQGDGHPILVPATDKRPAIEDFSGRFEDLDGDFLD